MCLFMLDRTLIGLFLLRLVSPPGRVIVRSLAYHVFGGERKWKGGVADARLDLVEGLHLV